MSKTITTTLFMIAAISCSSQSIKDLDFLIGTWQVEETILPGRDNEYQEKGTRTCEYYLDGSFIKCEASTVVSRNGKKRSYAYYINYDKEEDCFWATNFASDFPLHGLHQWFLDKENQQIIGITPRNVNKDRFFRHTISYANKDRIIWQGWSSKFRAPDKEWQHIFRDVATKKQ